MIQAAKPNPGGHICDRKGHDFHQVGEWLKCRNCPYQVKAGKR